MKIRGSWGICTTETFRWASGSSPKGYGTNLQTIPKQFRHVFLPPPGMVFGQPDLSQAEARIVAYLSRCGGLIELFADPSRSVHLENARRIFGRDVEKDTPEYVLAKAVVHAGNYRLGPFKFGQMLAITSTEAKKLLETYHSLYPEIRQWHNEIMRTLETTGTLTNPFGDRRVFYEAISCRSVTGKITDQQWKDAIAWGPQSVVPRLIGQAKIKLREELEYLRFHHNGHDSLLPSFPPEKMPEVAAAMKKHLEVPIRIHGRDLVIPVEFQVGYNWGDMMAFKGGVVSREEWEAWRQPIVANRRKKVLHGIYGPHLKDILEEALKEAA